MSDQKTCNACNLSLPLDRFPKNKARKDGLDAKCKTCLQAKNKAQYAKHAEKRRAYAADYAKAHAEERSAYGKQYHAENADKLNAYSREWRVRTGYQRPQELRERDRIARYERYRNDPVYRAECIAKSRA
ncbi:MAG: hypothetical protein ACYCOR_21020, partial [Acidobacteriaceae bacterium]